MTQRTDRLDSQIRAELMDLLQRELADPRVGFATITRVETAPDMRSARVWVSIYGDEDARSASMTALADAAPWLRHRLAQRLHVRRVPELLMRHDDSIAAGDRVLRLLRGIDEEREA